MSPDGGRRKRHFGHNPRARFYSYYRSLRFARHYQTWLWQQYQGMLTKEETQTDSEIYRVIFFDRPHIEEILRNNL